MIRAQLSQCQRVLTGATVRGDTAFSGVSTDSRHIEPGNLFVALRGERFDAHDFLADVVARGAAAVMVERDLPDIGVPSLVVPDTRRALGELGLQWRAQFNLPVIAVTGSNGKTTVKEMIAAILQAAFGEQALATRGNLNNELGVPQTLMRLTAECRAAVIEMGMNHPGEMIWLADMAQPTVVLVNNAQREHQEFMATVEAVARENGSAITRMSGSGCAVYPADDEYAWVWKEQAAGRPQLSFGLDERADVRASYVARDDGWRIEVTVGSLGFAFNLHAAGLHNVRNALAASTCALAAKVPIEAIVRGLEAFRPVSGRLQTKQAECGARVIDDTYNANPDSVRAAIDVLSTFAAPRVLVLGDMGEVGDQGEAFHREVGDYARERGIETLLCLGSASAAAVQAFGTGAQHFESIDTLRERVLALTDATTTVLVKGSRFMKMERVVQALIGTTEQDKH